MHTSTDLKESYTSLGLTNSHCSKIEYTRISEGAARIALGAHKHQSRLHGLCKQITFVATVRAEHCLRAGMLRALAPLALQEAT